MIKLLENITSVEEYNYMFDQVGWGAHNKEVSKEALKHNLYSVSIYDDDKIIGYGRMIGDQTVYAYIHDIMVVPDYQGQGIGKMVMEKLVEKIEEYQKISPSLRIYLGASKNREEFYQKFGFITREEANLGAGMIYKKKSN